MFADSLSAWSNQSHRGCSTLISFALLFLPVLYTEGLPRLVLLGPLLAPAPPPAAPPTHLHPNVNPIGQSNLMGDRLIAPGQIPPAVSMVTETTPPPPMVDPNAIGADRGVDDPRGRGNVLDSILGANQILVSPRPVARHPPVSHMMEGNLVYRVQPDYPPLARQVRVQGRVVLRAMISREGSIENLQVLGGHPMLVQAAVDAAPMAIPALRAQWRAVEVETEVTVDFVGRIADCIPARPAVARG